MEGEWAEEMKYYLFRLLAKEQYRLQIWRHKAPEYLFLVLEVCIQHVTAQNHTQ